MNITASACLRRCTKVRRTGDAIGEYYKFRRREKYTLFVVLTPATLPHTKHQYRQILVGAFAKLPKATVSLITCPPVRQQQLVSHTTDFREILYR
jgi:hypothetical protein